MSVSYLRPSSLAVACFAVGGMAASPANADFLSDSRGSISSRTLYLDANAREQDADQRQTATGLKFDYFSGYTDGRIGVGVDAQATLGVNLEGGIDNHGSTTANHFTPVDTDGTPVSQWSSLRAAAKARLSRTEIKAGNALAPNVPVLVTNDGRLLPASYQGAMLNSSDIDHMVVTVGRLNREIGRASSNWAGIAANGGTKGSDAFWFAGSDWQVRDNLMLQYYYANLQDYYRQNFLGLVHVANLGEGQTLKSDIRFFNSRSDGRNGQAGYLFNNNSGYAKHPGKVNNDTWSAMFTYAFQGHSVLLGHQQVGDDGGMAIVNSGSVRDGRARPEGEIGASYYLFTDSMANAFVRAGENTTFGQYAYDFARLGVAGLKAAVTYLHATGIKDAGGSGDTYREWERDYRMDYVVQSGPAKGLGFTLRRANYRTGVPDAQGGYDIDQTRFYVNYTYVFK